LDKMKWPAAGGAAGALVRTFDWAATPLGPVERWTPSLRALVELVLVNPVASALVWGEQGTLIYNDGYARICGDRHPQAFGASLRDAWPEAWDFNGPNLARCRAGNPQVFRNAHFVLERDGRTRDCWFDLYYAPVCQDGETCEGVVATVVEITERVLVERARAVQADELRVLNAALDTQRSRLEAANQRLAGDMRFIKNLFQSSPSFMAVLIGPDHRFELTNAAYDALIQHREAQGRPVREVMPEVAKQGFVALLDRVYGSGEAFHGRDVEVMLDAGDGTGPARRILDFVYQPLRNADGQIYGILVEGVDVTARALAEERLRVAQEAGGVGTFEWYPARGEMRVSDAYRSLCGMAAGAPVTEDMLLGLGDETGLPGDLRDYAERAIRRADTGERRWLARRGQQVGLERQGEPRYLGVAFDITDRKLAEQALRASESRLQTLFAQASVGIAETGPDGRFLRVNHAFCRLLGRDAQAMLGLNERDVIHAGDLAESLVASGTAFAEGRAGALDRRYLRADGSVVWAHAGISRILDGEGRPVSLIAVTTDLTERRRVEARLRELNESLERTVSNEVGERLKAEGALRHAQKMEAVGQLASGIAHDFNNVLQIISSNLELVEREFAGAARQAERLAHARSAVARGSRLSLQLLAFGRKQSLQPVVTQLGLLLGDIAPLLQRAIGDGVGLSIAVEPGLWSVAVDRNQFENAILNIAINARDAMAGSGSLRIAARNLADPDGERVALAISDNGCGMAPEVLAKVFDPFYTTKEAGKGTGLGMSMVYGFVRQSNGQIRIDSLPGRGTTIVIELPRTEGEHEADDEAAASCLERGSETILLVEDDPAVRVASVDMLAGLGYRMLTAADGEQALDILHSGAAVDLMFSDVSMPGRVKATQLVRQAARLAPRMAVVLTSGHAVDRALLGEDMPADVALLPKPYVLAQLARTIRAGLDARVPDSAQGAPGRQGALRFLVVEDEPDARSLACEMLEALGCEAHGAASAEQALALLAHGAFDVLFTDLHLPGMAGDALAAQACALRPGLQVVLASGEGLLGFEASACVAMQLPKPYDLLQLQQTIAMLERALARADASTDAVSLPQVP